MHKKQRIVLCVDDDPDDQMLMLDTIKEIDPSVRVASALNGREALLFLERAKTNGGLPCLVILDINMPVMDGKETIMNIKKDNAFDRIPLSLFSTSSAPLDKAFGEKYGVHFMTKPINVTSFRNSVSELLSLTSNC